MSHTPVIETSGLTIGYAQKGKKPKVVHDSLQLQLYAGRLTALLGLNGAGKSTLLRTICGLRSALGGEIRIKGRPLPDYSQDELSRIIGVVLTEKTNAGGITAEELVALGRHPYTGFFGRPKAADKRIVAESLEVVGMTHKATGYVSELSDGERQKIMIAKVLAQQCPVIILDEPTAFLDVTSRIETMSLLHRLATEQGKAVLLSTHDLDLAIQMSDCLWLQEKGRDMMCGVPEDLILSGAFETFFNKKGIMFDSFTGKLAAGKPSRPIAVEGDYKTAYWVGNALIRNGFRPSSTEESEVIVSCPAPGKISLYIPGMQVFNLHSIAELISIIMTHKNEILRFNAIQ
ncbi:MAG: ABC transporter ATP-binding protein [Tannerella sp.]|jgi:iron complex transport system ATP-binding protein|nr:ABC transporter ATP-binding protein [Tannerella sp.]